MVNSLATKAVIESLGCTNLEANELASGAVNFALKAQMLAKAYKSEYVTEAQNHQSDLRNHANKDRLGRLLGSKPTLSYGAKNMWARFKEMDEAFSQFSHVNAMHQTGLDANRALTATLQALNENRGIPGRNDPERIVEGRRVYESLRPYSSLMSQIGL